MFYFLYHVATRWGEGEDGSYNTFFKKMLLFRECYSVLCTAVIS